MESNEDATTVVIEKTRERKMNNQTKSMIRIAILVAIPSILPGQPAVNSWDNLRLLRAGQKIDVVNMQMKTVTGKFSAFTGDAISLAVGNDQVSVARANVASVKNREASHRLRNTLLGLAIGAGTGAVIGATLLKSSESGEELFGVMVVSPIGAGIGAGTGAALPAGHVTVYRAQAIPKK